MFDASPVGEGSQNIFCCAIHAFMDFSSSAHRSGVSNLGLQEQDYSLSSNAFYGGSSYELLGNTALFQQISAKHTLMSYKLRNHLN